MEPIAASSRQRRLERALVVLEGLTYFVDEETNVDPIDAEKLREFVSQVYRIAHSALGHCKGCTFDSVWLNDIEKAEKTLTESNILDVDKYFTRLDAGDEQ